MTLWAIATEYAKRTVYWTGTGTLMRGMPEAPNLSEDEADARLFATREDAEAARLASLWRPLSEYRVIEIERVRLCN